MGTGIGKLENVQLKAGGWHPESYSGLPWPADAVSKSRHPCSDSESRMAFIGNVTNSSGFLVSVSVVSAL